MRMEVRIRWGDESLNGGFLFVGCRFVLSALHFFHTYLIYHIVLRGGEGREGETGQACFALYRFFVFLVSLRYHIFFVLVMYRYCCSGGCTLCRLGWYLPTKVGDSLGYHCYLTSH